MGSELSISSLVGPKLIVRFYSAIFWAGMNEEKEDSSVFSGASASWKEKKINKN